MLTLTAARINYLNAQAAYGKDNSAFNLRWVNDAREILNDAKANDVGTMFETLRADLVKPLNKILNQQEITPFANA
jgi:hypothetical protein